MLTGVETKRVNEAVKNNPDKFPEDYMFTLTSEEVKDLRSKFSSTKISTKSKSAQNVTFAIIETFTKVRYLKREIVNLHNETDKKKQTSRLERFGEVISDIVMPDLETDETESSLELNFIIGKIKHTVKRSKKNK